MGILGKLRSFTQHVLATLNVLVVLAMCLTAYAGHVSTSAVPLCEVLSLAFPIPVVVNLFFLLFWLLASPKLSLIPLAGFLLCYSPLRDYCPVNIPKAPPEESIKVLSYNVCNFIGPQRKDENVQKCIDYILDVDADIVCLQESSAAGKKMKKLVAEQLESAYPYFQNVKKKGGEKISIYSRYPIRWTMEVPYESETNVSAVHSLDIDGDSLLVFNCHLQTVGLTPVEKGELKDFVDRKTNHIDEKPFVEKITQNAVLRARQARLITRTLKKHPDASFLLCGDINSSPVSYPHYCISSVLTDCYRATGNGLGFTYSRGGIYERIDNIFCSSDWKPYRCHVDTKISISDHYPVVCWIKKRSKP